MLSGLQPGGLALVWTDSPAGKKFELRRVSKVDDMGAFVDGKGARYFPHARIALTPASEDEGNALIAQIERYKASYEGDRRVLRQRLDHQIDMLLAGQSNG